MKLCKTCAFVCKDRDVKTCFRHQYSTIYVKQLEQKNAKLQSDLNVYKNVASGVADPLIVPLRLDDLEQQNAKLIESLKYIIKISVDGSAVQLHSIQTLQEVTND